MRALKRVGIVVALAVVTVGVVGPAASAAPMPWETSRAQGVVAVSPAEVGTVTVLCGDPCYQ
ncbi:hypothetical protein ABZT04_05235 [Streptomyces sp. NPDC005492]|uniref:hypothetical protein n=1 Tax=Streptomyces sp. NPDC005492 TaxID=3156883 RepID=UPI0033A42383